MLSVFTCTCKYTLHVRVSLVETIRLANQLSYMATYGHWAQKRSWLFEGFAILIRFGELHRHYYGALKKSHWQLLGPALNRDIGASTVGPYVCWLCCGTRSKAGGQRLSSWAGHILPK